MEILVVIVPVIIGVVFVMAIAGTILHFLAFGSIFWLLGKKIGEQQEAAAPRECAYCGATIPQGRPQCHSCGASRERPAKN